MKFLVDQMMGRLYKWLIMLGYDAEYNDGKDMALVRKKCTEENRIFITKSPKNLKRAQLSNSIFITEESLAKQLKIMLQYLNFDFSEQRQNIFSRCLKCNTLIIKKEKKDLINRVPEKSYQFYSEFYECPKCNKILWKGTHYTKTIKELEKIIQKD
jgi:uncharacterized protein